MSAKENILKLCAAGGVTLALLAGAAGLAAAKPSNQATVIAPSDSNTRVERVSYRDLNLTMASHQKLLTNRVGRAANYVCEPLDTSGFNQDWRFCKAGALNSARPQIALAIQRANEIAASGFSSIPPVTIVLAIPSR